MKIKFIKASLVLVLIGAALWLVWDFNRIPTQEIVIKEKKFRVEIAETNQEKELGLGERDSLCEKCAMLFVFAQKGPHSFWMKGMRFPLDIIWFDGKDGTILHIEKKIAPDFKGTLNPPVMADRVLEINGGLVEKYGIQKGDRIDFGE